MNLQLLGWGPDLDPATPGVIVDMDGVIPTTDGFRALETDAVMASDAGTYFPRSLIIANAASQTHAVVAAYGSTGTATTCTLFEIQYGGSYVSRGTYTAGTYTTPVMLRQFDGDIFSARKNSPIKRASVGASFSDATGAPSAALIESTRDFVIAFNTVDGYDWHCCALGDAGDWTPAISTQSARGIFYDKGGPIIASGRFGEYVLAFTASQTWLGRYVGTPEVWQWEQISRDVGCIGPEAVCETPAGICWVSKSDVHVYDGQSIQPLNTEPVRVTAFGLIARELIQHCQLAWDSKHALLWMFYPTGTASTQYSGRDAAIVYHMPSKKWAKIDNFGVSAANQIQTPDYSGLSTSSPTNVYDDFAYMRKVSPSGLYLYRFSPSSTQFAAGYVTTGVMGDPVMKTMCKSVRPRYSEIGNDVGTAVLVSKLYSMASTAVTQVAPFLDLDQKYQFRQTGRYHSIRLAITTTDVVSGMDVELVPMGSR